MIFYDKFEPKKSILTVFLNPFFVEDYFEAARRYNIKKCVDNIAVLREFDLKSKGYGIGDVEQKDLYREMIYKLMR